MMGGIKRIDSLIEYMVLELAKFDSCACFFKQFLRSVSFVFSSLLFDWCRCAVNDCFCFTKAKTGDFFYSFDNCNFLCTSIFKNYVKFALLVFASPSSVAARAIIKSSRCVAPATW